MPDCVIDLVSPGAVKHYIGDGIKCQIERCPRLIYWDHRTKLLRNGENGNGHSNITPKEKVSVIRERKLRSFYVTREGKFRIFSRILQTLTQLMMIRIHKLCALGNWITNFVRKKTYRLSDTCLGKWRQMKESRWINTFANRQDTVISVWR